MEVTLAESAATESLGQALARALPAAVYSGTAVAPPVAAPGAAAATGADGGAGTGAVVHLRGELGAGKTTCVRSLLRTLGVTGLVRSPTYTLVETYVLPALTCVHVDLYRLQTQTEVDELGLRDLVGPGCLMLVEWPENGGTSSPPADLDLTLSYAGDGRQAALRANTAVGIAWMTNLGHDTSLSSYVSNIT